MMINIKKAILCLFLFPVFCFSGEGIKVQNISEVEIYFSPKGGCTDAIIREIKKAEKTIHIQAYSFTSLPIAEALVEASKKGIMVEVVLDKKQRSEKYSQASLLIKSNISVYSDGKHAIAHNKIIIIDEKTVITGSFNYSKGAEFKNSENLLIIRSTELYKIYYNNFLIHQDHSEKF